MKNGRPPSRHHTSRLKCSPVCGSSQNGEYEVFIMTSHCYCICCNCAAIWVFCIAGFTLMWFHKHDPMMPNQQQLW